MVHPLVEQMRFARSEFKRALEGITDEEAQTRLLPMNSISWIICHLAWQERTYWLVRAQDIADAFPELDELGAWGKPASTPPLAQAWAIWEGVAAAVDPYLDTLTSEPMKEHIKMGDQLSRETIGTMLQRVVLHYWFHTGESYAIRQMFGHTDLPQFVGALGEEAPFRG